jgi:hypothetical protein
MNCHSSNPKSAAIARISPSPIFTNPGQRQQAVHL